MIRLLAIATALMAAEPLHDVAAAEAGSCLSRDQRRSAIQNRKAVPLGRAIRSAKARYGGDVLDARLCRRERGLVYVLTLLARDGKVMHVRVDAGSGAYLGH